MNHELEPWGRRANGAWLPQRPPAWPADRFSQATQLRSQLQRFAHALRRRWWIFLLPLTLIGLPAMVYSYLKPPNYQSQASMWLQTDGPRNNILQVDLQSFIATQAQLLKNPIIMARALARVLRDFPGLRRPSDLPAALNSPFDLSVRSTQRTLLVELRATGLEPKSTRAFLDAVMDEYLAFKKESKTRSSSDALSGLKEQMAGVESQVRQLENQIALFGLSNNVPYLNNLVQNAGSEMARLDAEVAKLKTELQLLQELTLEQFKERLLEGGQPPVDAAWQAAYISALTQLESLTLTRQKFATVLRPEHSKMRKLDEDIAQQKKILAELKKEEEQKLKAKKESQMAALELHKKNLESQRRDWETNAAGASQKLLPLSRMQQELQGLQSQHNNLRQEQQLWQIVDKSRNQDWELVPLAPASPARPTLTKYGTGAAGLFLSLLMGIGAFTFLSFLDDRFTSARELSLQLPIEVVGQVPRARLGRPGALRRLLPEENAAFAESFRNLRSAVFFMHGQQNQPKVVLVTSAIPKEGKSTVASNLARTLALSGARVLLVDADLRRSSIHQLFKIRPGPGLLEVLSQGLEPQQAIVPTEEATLFILPAGIEGNASSDLFLGPAMEQLLQELRQQYHYVVIDTAPVLATDDAATLGPQVDGAFLVVRAAYTSSQMAREALQRLQQRNVKVLGTVYNGASPSKDYYCQYSRDYYGGKKTAGRE